MVVLGCVEINKFKCGIEFGSFKMCKCLECIVEKCGVPVNGIEKFGVPLNGVEKF